MKKRTCLLLFCLFTLVLCLGLASCKENPPVNNDPIVWSKPVALPAPTGLAIADDVLIWEPVEGAEGYTVLCNGKRYICEGTSLDVSNIITRPNVEFSFTVIAKGDGRKALDSLSSEPLLYTLSVSSEGIDFIKLDGFDYYVAYAKDPTKVVGGIYIPGEYEGLPVKEIMTEGFQGCTELTHVFLHEDIKRIGEYAFAGSTKLKFISFSKALAEIGFCAFQDCVSLASVNFPERLSEVSGTAFLGCTSLVELKVQSNNTTFRAEANCLIRRYNNELIMYAGDGSGVLPSSVQAIGAYAFYRSPMETVVLHEGITKIGDYAFSESAIQNPSLPFTLTTIGSNAFSYCEGITKVIIRENVRRIEERAYYTCSGLSFVSIPDTVYSIGAEAFAKLEKTMVMLSGQVSAIDWMAFEGKEMTIYVSHNTLNMRTWPENWKHEPEKDPKITWKYYDTPYCANSVFKTDESGALYMTETHLIFKDEFSSFYESRLGDGIYGFNQPLDISTGEAPPNHVILVHVSGHLLLEDGIVAPVREGYVFLGWALEEGGPVVHAVHEDGKTLTAEEIGFYRAINSTTTLYAVWEKNA